MNIMYPLKIKPILVIKNIAIKKIWICDYNYLKILYLCFSFLLILFFFLIKFMIVVKSSLNIQKGIR